MERRLAAILAADVVGYSRLMAVDETGTHARLRALRRELIEPLTAEHHGRIVKLMGDGALVEFGSVVDAVECAVAVQQGVAVRQADLREDQRIRFRIGINLGDVIIEDEDIYGDGVNVAARLEPLAPPGGICVSNTVHDHVKGKLDVAFAPMGEHRVKNIPAPITVHRVITGVEAPADPVPAPVRAGPSSKRWAIAAAAALALFGAGGLVLWLQPWESSDRPSIRDEAPARTDRPSLAVLPFDNLSADPEEEYFADGLTDDLITDLSKISGLLVIARNSVFTYKDQAVDIREVARELGVRYVLEGSVRRAGNQVRINAQLIDGDAGTHLWAERYERKYADIFTLQDEVIQSIVEALSVELTETEQSQVARLPTENLEAYDYYLRAEERAESGSAAEALTLFQKAIALDPTFADAYAGDARVATDVLAYSFADTLPAAVARKRAYEAAGRALALNPKLSRGYSVLALLQMLDGEHGEALTSARKAVTLSPNSAEAYLNLAIVLVLAGEPEKALEAMETVFQLDPKPSPRVHDYQGLVLYMNHRYAEAIAALQDEDYATDSDFGLETLAAANAQIGRMDEAKVAIDKLLDRHPGHSLASARVSYAHHAREEDVALRLDGLRLAGLPEWPYGLKGDPEHRLSADEIDGLTFGRTWIGKRAGFGPFMQYIGPDGAFIERGPDYQLVGTLSRRGDDLCLQTPVVFLGRPQCGPIYRNPAGKPETQDEYIYLNAYLAKWFTASP